ncbi:hypothetical protein [Thalassospira sp. UBA1131]|uniref:phage major tropism determinant n=1 Tax=Thalassospira sp. UBA1131 TaxID=1947672 RepID=UPI0025D8BC5D|nr:hypothetical protein [Thalassospira sp. UBA1131]
MSQTVKICSDVNIAQFAAFAGYFSMDGQISATGATTLNIPECLVNIGGNGHGYLLVAQSDWSIVEPTHHDGSLNTLALGDDIRLFAVDAGDGTTDAKLIASKNDAFPDGYDASNSRKIGGFHYGRVRPVASRYDLAYSPAIQIVPNSVWDLNHRPTCDPSGMVEIVPGGFWADIYLNSEGAGTWPENVPVSKYGVMPIKDDVYARSDFHLLVRNAGKRLPTIEEFLTYAEGAPAGQNGNNTYAWSATSNTGPTTTGNVEKSVSMFNVVDAVGNLWDWLDGHFDLGATNYNQSTYVVNVGQDLSTPRGAVFHAGWRCFVGGGFFNYGENSGSRCLHSDAGPWGTDGIVGLRGICCAL